MALLLLVRAQSVVTTQEVKTKSKTRKQGTTARGSEIAEKKDKIVIKNVVKKAGSQVTFKEERGN